MIATLAAITILTFLGWATWMAWRKGYMAALGDRDVIDDVFGSQDDT